MPQNDFLPFATGAGANVLTQGDYAALVARQTGFQSGTALSQHLNKVWRQSSAMTAALGLFASTRGPLSALDNGDVAALELAVASAIAYLDQTCAYAPDLGTVNNVVVNLVPAAQTYVEGMKVRFVPGSTNTDVAFLNINGLGNRSIYRRDGSFVQPADLAQGSPAEVIYIGGPSTGAFRLMSPAQSEFAKVQYLPIFYVRPDGNDNNDGSANTPGKAFATIQGAVLNGTNKITLAGRTASIILGIPGTYNAPSFPGTYANAEASLQTAGTLLIQGNIANQGAYIISGSGAPATSGIVHIAYGSQAILRGITINNTSTSSLHTLTATTGSAVYLEYCTFTGSGLTTGTHIMAQDGAVMKMGPGINIASSAGAALGAIGAGLTQMRDSPINIQGNLTFPNFATATLLGRILCPGAAGFTGGSVTGTKYLAQHNSVIFTAGAGANYFPGGTAGSTSSGGLYV